MKKGFSQGVCAITDAELINSTPSAHYEAVLARLDSEDREVIERLRARLTGIRNIGPARAADLIIRMGMAAVDRQSGRHLPQRLGGREAAVYGG